MSLLHNKNSHSSVRDVNVTDLLFQEKVYEIQNLNQALRSANDVLTQDDVHSISQFVQEQCFNTLEILQRVQSQNQIHRSVESLIQNLLDFILMQLPPNRTTARFVGDWIYSFYAQVKQNEPQTAIPETNTKELQPTDDNICQEKPEVVDLLNLPTPGEDPDQNHQNNQLLDDEAASNRDDAQILFQEQLNGSMLETLTFNFQQHLLAVQNQQSILQDIKQACEQIQVEMTSASFIPVADPIKNWSSQQQTNFNTANEDSQAQVNTVGNLIFGQQQQQNGIQNTHLLQLIQMVEQLDLGIVKQSMKEITHLISQNQKSLHARLEKIQISAESKHDEILQLLRTQQNLKQREQNVPQQISDRKPPKIYFTDVQYQKEEPQIEVEYQKQSSPLAQQTQSNYFGGKKQIDLLEPMMEPQETPGKKVLDKTYGLTKQIQMISEIPSSPKAQNYEKILNNSIFIQSHSASAIQNQNVTSDEDEQFEDELNQLGQKQIFFQNNPAIQIQGSLKKSAESIARYVEQLQEPYEINWQSTFMSRATEEQLFVRGKYNVLDVVDARTLRYISTIDTGNCGVFSSITNHSTNQAYLGSYEGHFFVVDLANNMQIVESGYKKLRQGIYDMVILPDNSNTIMVCQHFGFIEFVSLSENSILEGGVQLPTNSIFQIAITKRMKVFKQSSPGYGPWEYALSTYSGLYFIHVTKNRNYNKSTNANTINNISGQQRLDEQRRPITPPPYEISLLKEVFFKDKNVSRFLEYAPGMFAVCLFKDDQIYLLNRLEGSIQKVRKPGGKSCCFELCSIPGFNLNVLPFLFMRDDKNLYLVCTREGCQQVIALAPARYESKQSYKTMEVITSADGGDDFNLAVLTHMNDQTSRVVMFHFDTDFIDCIREKWRLFD